MSTGIGKHKFNKEAPKLYHGSHPAICPYCGYDNCDADYVYIDFGQFIQCGPYYCDKCESSEISSRDKRELTDKEKETGWYEPHTPPSETANTFNGKLVDHTTAKKLYNMGLFDKKHIDKN